MSKRSRSLNHPQVRIIVRALDRAEASERLHPDSHAAVLTVAGSIIETDDRFWCGRQWWTPKAVREVVLCWAKNCPADELEQMAAKARDQLKWLEWWDREGWDLEGRDIAAEKARRAA